MESEIKHAPEFKLNLNTKTELAIKYPTNLETQKEAVLQNFERMRSETAVELLENIESGAYECTKVYSVHSQGKVMEIMVVAMKDEQEYSFRNLKACLFDSGVLQAVRGITVFEGEDDYSTEGSVVTFSRGKGYALALETVVEDSLKHLDLDPTKKLHWNVVNANSSDFEESKKNYQRIQTGDNTALISLPQQERQNQNWLKLWGEGGKLGFKKTGRMNGKNDIYSKEVKIEGMPQKNMLFNLDLDKGSIESTGLIRDNVVVNERMMGMLENALIKDHKKIRDVRKELQET